VELRIRVGLTAALSIGVSLAILPAAFAQYDAAPRVDLESERRAAPAEPVTLPRGVVEAASAYEAYQRKAVAIRASFKDGEAINRAMIVGETYQPEQMEEGLVAYAAMIALDDAAFVSGVRAMARGPEGAAQEADGLLADPASVTAISGSAEAAALAGAVLREEGGQLLAAGQAVKQSAYDIQRESWSRQMAPDAAGRLARAKLLSTSAVIPAPEEVSSLLQAAAGFQGRHASGERVFTPTLERGLTLAALAVLGQANDERRLAGLWPRHETAGCMKMAKLNLYQCLAVAGPHYEDVFCLGQHAMMDTGQCIAGFGGGTPARTEPSLSSAAEGGIAVPVADNTYRR
jgi:hypothetical protein